MRRLVLLLAFLPLPTAAQEVLGLGYVLDQPLPVLAGVADPEFTETVGIGAEWLAFDNQSALLQALQAGKVGIAIGIGPEALLDGISTGADLKLVDIAAVYPRQVVCVLRGDIAESGASLYGLRVALPYGSAAELAFNAQMAALGADAASAVRRDLAPVDAAAALVRGEAEIACGDGPATVRMLDNGVELMPADAVFDLGQRWYSGVVATGEFAARQPRVIAGFIAAQANLGGDLAAIAKAADMGEIDAEAVLAAQRSLSVEEKLSGDWFGGGLAAYLTELAALRLAREQFTSNPAAIGAVVTAEFLGAVSD